jgi:hypothetical protein
MNNHKNHLNQMNHRSDRKKDEGTKRQSEQATNRNLFTRLLVHLSTKQKLNL